MCENINTINKSSRDLLEAIKGGWSGSKAEKIMYLFMTRHQNAGHINEIFIASKSFKNMVQFKHLGAQ
jgi:hypothetical protein